MSRFQHSLILCLVFMAASWGQAVTVTVDSLFPATALRVGRILPFRLNVTGMKKGDVTSAEVENVPRTECRAQQDPFRPNFVLLLCKKPKTGIYVTVEYLEGQTRKAVRMGPLTIAALPTTIATPTPTPTPVPQTPAQLTTEKCLSCHSATPHTIAKLKEKAGLGKLTVPYVKSIINQTSPNAYANSQMISVSVTDAQLTTIINYVNSQ